jgi:hypothetical protein
MAVSPGRDRRWYPDTARRRTIPRKWRRIKSSFTEPSSSFPKYSWNPNIVSSISASISATNLAYLQIRSLNPSIMSPASSPLQVSSSSSRGEAELGGQHERSCPDDLDRSTGRWKLPIRSPPLAEGLGEEHGAAPEGDSWSGSQDLISRSHDLPAFVPTRLSPTSSSYPSRTTRLLSNSGLIPLRPAMLESPRRQPVSISAEQNRPKDGGN